MSKGAIVALVVLVVLSIGGLWGYKQQQMGKSSDQALADVMASLQTGRDYKANAAYLDGVVKWAHDDAFAKAYTHGGLTSKADFDEGLYLHEIWEAVDRKVREDNRADLVRSLPRINLMKDEEEPAATTP